MIDLLLSKKLIKVRVSRSGTEMIMFWRQINNFATPSVYRDVSNKENILPKLSEVSNKMFSSLRKKGFITEKQLKYFTYEYKKATNFGKLYLLPKIHKRLFDVPGRPVISNCGTPTEKCSEFLDHHLKKVMQKDGPILRIRIYIYYVILMIFFLSGPMVKGVLRNF